MSFAHPLLRIKTIEQADACVVRVEGELDQSSAATLEGLLADAVRSGPDRVLVDLDGLDFIDSHGLQTLLAAARRSAANGGRLRMTHGTGDVARMLRLTMLDMTLPFASGS